jgi:hypothetical protein
MNKLTFINQKNAYTVFSIVIIAIVAMYAASVWKKKLEDQISEKMIDSLIRTGKLSVTDSVNPSVIITLKSGMISILSSKSLYRLYSVNKMTEDQMDALTSSIK